MLRDRLPQGTCKDMLDWQDWPSICAIQFFHRHRRQSRSRLIELGFAWAEAAGRRAGRPLNPYEERPERGKGRR